MLNGSLHDSEPLRKIAHRRMGGGEEGRGPQQTSLLWFSHDSSAQQMSMSNRASVCVCVRAHLHGAGPLPLLSTASSLRLQHATDLVAKVTSCVDGFTSVLITG